MKIASFTKFKKFQLLPVTADRFLAMVNEEIIYRIEEFLNEHGVEPNAVDLQEIKSEAIQFIEIKIDDGHR